MFHCTPITQSQRIGIGIARLSLHAHWRELESGRDVLECAPPGRRCHAAGRHNGPHQAAGHQF